MKDLYVLIALLLGAAAPTCAEDYFDLSAINPSIVGENGTYDAETQTLHTDTYGFGGWVYDDGIDLSGYDQLTIVLEANEDGYDGASFRIYDANEYYNEKAFASYEFTTNTVTIDLHNMTKEVTTTGEDETETTETVTIDPSHIYMAGFWTYGDEGKSITINSITLSTTSVAVTTDWFNLETLNPNVYGENGTCTYNEEKDAYFLQTDTYGFGGWKYENGIDLSGYTKIVIELAEGQTDGASFHLYDSDNYWDACASFDFDWGSSTLTVDLSNVTKEVTSTDDNGNTSTETVDLDLTHIYIAGFWTYGAGQDNNGIYIKSITLYQSTDAENQNQDENGDEGTDTDVAVSTDWFDLTQINPNLYPEEGTGKCTYDEDKDAYFLQTDTYGFGGWAYDPAIDLSGYTKLVIELEEAQTDGAQFRLLTGGYYDDDKTAFYNIGYGASSLTIDLTNVESSGDDITVGEYFSLTSICEAGFWSYGAGDDNNGIYIKSITLYKSASSSETDDGDDSTGISNVSASASQAANGVYTLTGVKISDNDACLKSLTSGIYIVNGRKIAVK